MKKVWCLVILILVMSIELAVSFPFTVYADRAGSGIVGDETSDTDESRDSGGHHLGDRDTGHFQIGENDVFFENNDVYTNLVVNSDGTRTLKLRQRILSYYGLSYGFKYLFISRCTGEGYFVQKSYYSIIHDLEQNTMTLSIASYVFSDKPFSVVANNGGSDYAGTVVDYKGIYFFKSVSFSGTMPIQSQGYNYELYLQGL